MCGICGLMDLQREDIKNPTLITRMLQMLQHRGPDDEGIYQEKHVHLGFRRLSIIDLSNGGQPLYNEDYSIVLVCNGEIFNYRELRETLHHQGHVFRTNSDAEVIIHLYEQHNVNFLELLNGQFAFALFDEKEQQMLLARDHFGVCPLHYTITNGIFAFSSEIKALLTLPWVHPAVDLIGLDQICTFPGLISPRTLFTGISSLKSGHMIMIKQGEIAIKEYWDLVYPLEDYFYESHTEQYYRDHLISLLKQSIKYRLLADVDVGFYLSGGLDSSFILALAKHMLPDWKPHTFSISFPGKAICESHYHKLMAQQAETLHHEVLLDWQQIDMRLREMVRHAESPLSETYNTASLELSALAKANNISVILTGEGADELFAGYIGYRFDQFHRQQKKSNRRIDDFEALMEAEMSRKLWGDEAIVYESALYPLSTLKKSLFSEHVNEYLLEQEDIYTGLVDVKKLQGRHFIHQRSYLDFKLRLSDHLLSDHGDRMAMANSVEARYPFLDIHLVEFVKKIPPSLKLHNFTEKYILKQAAQQFVPQEIVQREKFAFHAPGSPYLLNQQRAWIHDILSSDLIKKQGYFNPVAVEQLKKQYLDKNFHLNLPFERDLLMIVLTFGIFLDVFQMPVLH